MSLHANQTPFTAQWLAPAGATDDAGRCIQQAVAQTAADQLRKARDAQVLSVDTERVTEQVGGRSGSDVVEVFLRMIPANVLREG